MLEGDRLVFMGLHKGMGHGAVDRNVIFHAGEDRRGSGEAGQIAGSRGEQACLRTVRPAQSEIDERFPAGDQDRPRRLRGDHGLEIQQIHDAGFDELGLGKRRDDSENRLMRKKDRSFRHRMDFAGEPQPFQ